MMYHLGRNHYLDVAIRLCRGFMFINGSEIYNPFIALTEQNACSNAVLVHLSQLTIQQRGFENRKYTHNWKKHFMEKTRRELTMSSERLGRLDLTLGL